MAVLLLGLDGDALGRPPDVNNLSAINTSNNLTKRLAMNQYSGITIDDETAYRERATALLDAFAQQARGILRNAGIGIDLIFVVPASGDVILTFGTAAELYSEDWKAVRATVSSLVRRAVGLDPAQCRDVLCSMAHAGDLPLDRNLPDLKRLRRPPVPPRR